MDICVSAEVADLQCDRPWMLIAVHLILIPFIIYFFASFFLALTAVVRINPIATMTMTSIHIICHGIYLSLSLLRYSDDAAVLNHFPISYVHNTKNALFQRQPQPPRTPL